MDPTVLVSRERAERAGQLLSRLRADGLVTLGAVWGQAEGDGQPYLYVITPNVETEGLLEANLRLGRTLRAFQQGVSDPYLRLDPYEIKLIGPSDPFAREILELYQDFPDDQPTFYYGSTLTREPLKAAYIYPAAMFDAPAAPSA
jgi:hypothetical protein